ncbi:MAG TPA: M1 family metallopeptidase, partial [Candidatus Saccharimonadales bacterium]|nr:M1 family metallopeptidase [Candidatus Saccharimonadales bacterium]
MHELSHQWFGNLVTMKWWDDLWLNESFANVMEYVGPDVLFPEWEVWNTFITSEGLPALRRDSIAGVQAVKTEVHHPDEISTLFDPSIVYAKGGRLLNMMMNYVGEDDFRKGLKKYFTSHAYSNTTGNDLWAALGQASGKDVAGFMDPWLTRSGFPVVTVDQHGKQLEISQKHFLQDPTKADSKRLWPVPLLSDSHELPKLLEEAKIRFELSSDTYIRINSGAVGHYIVHYANPDHIKSLAALVANQKLGIAERLMLLTDSSMLARAGTQSFATCLELLQKYIQEDSEPVWDIMAVIIADLKRFIDDDSNLELPIKGLVRRLIEAQHERLGWEEKQNESSQDTKLRASIIALGVYAEHPGIKQHALELFEQYKADPGIIHPELRGIVFGAAVRNGVEGAFEYLLALDGTTQSVDLKQDILSALTLTKSSEQVCVLLSRLKNPDEVRQQDVDHWIAYLLRNRHVRDQSWAWLRDNWGWIEATFAADKSYDYFPRY